MKATVQIENSKVDNFIGLVEDSLGFEVSSHLLVRERDAFSTVTMEADNQEEADLFYSITQLI